MVLVLVGGIFVVNRLIIKGVNWVMKLRNITQPWSWSRLCNISVNLRGIVGSSGLDLAWIGLGLDWEASPFLPEAARAAANANNKAAEEEEEKEEDRHNHKTRKRIETKCLTDDIQV